MFKDEIDYTIPAIIFGAVIVLGVSQYLDKIKYLGTQIKIFTSNSINIFWNFLITLKGILVVIFVIIIFLIIIRIIKFIRKKINAKLRKKHTINCHKAKAKKIVELYVNEMMNLDEFIKKATNLLDDISYFPELTFERNMVSKELLKAEERKVISKHHEDIKLLNLRKAMLKEEIEDQKRAVKNDGEWTKKDILKRLNTENHLVYERKRITKEQCDILLEERYKQVNEYCVFKNKIITVLVRPIGNHSIPHAFLVWSAKRLLKKLGIKNIKERLTVDADLIFEYDNKKYAIEIECGSLVKKHKQMKEKVEYLNKKYSNRWMFLVSHKKLISKYKKFGLTYSRANIKENLAKMLKIAHPDLAGVN